MKKRVIHKNFHRPFGLPAFMRYFGMVNKSVKIENEIKFDRSCMHDLVPDEDNKDWSKLFGISFGLFNIHKQSVRFGWRYSKDKDLIEICYIIYQVGDDGNVTVQRTHIADVEFDELVRYTIEINRDTSIPNADIMNCTLKMSGRDINVNTSVYATDVMFRCGCGFYFGGNQKAPHKMWIYENSNVTRL